MHLYHFYETYCYLFGPSLGGMTSLMASGASSHKLYFGFTTKRFDLLHFSHFIKHSFESLLPSSAMDISADTPGIRINPHCLHIVRFISGSLEKSNHNCE